MGKNERFRGIIMDLDHKGKNNEIKNPALIEIRQTRKLLLIKKNP
jgi:hypothetical protein